MINPWKWCLDEIDRYMDIELDFEKQYTKEEQLAAKVMVMLLMSGMVLGSMLLGLAAVTILTKLKILPVAIGLAIGFGAYKIVQILKELPKNG